MSRPAHEYTSIQALKREADAVCPPRASEIRREQQMPIEFGQI